MEAFRVAFSDGLGSVTFETSGYVHCLVLSGDKQRHAVRILIDPQQRCRETLFATRSHPTITLKLSRASENC
jgi:hypothetical protein